MHNDLTKANLNAWHYWWLYCSNNSGCLYDTGTKVWAKRLWAMGNFSRFVRPGWKRVDTSGAAPSGVLVSAYINPANNALSDRGDQQRHVFEDRVVLHRRQRAVRAHTL